MQFNVLLLALFATASYALDGFAPNIVGGKLIRPLTDATKTTTKTIKSEYKTTEVRTQIETKEHKTVTKTVTDIHNTKTTFTTVVKYTTKVPVPKTTLIAGTTTTTSQVTPTSFPSCQATLRPAPKADCGSLAVVVNPSLGSPYVIKKQSLTSCQNACVCGEAKANCMAFAWDSTSEGSTLGTCTLYSATLEAMGTMQKDGQNQILYDRSCFHRDTVSTSAGPTMTMGALVIAPVGKRSPIDDRIVGVLAGI